MTDRLLDPPANAIVAALFAASFAWARLVDRAAVTWTDRTHSGD